MHRSDLLNLWCLVDSDPTGVAFQITVHRDAAVGIFEDAIKTKILSDLYDIDAKNLVLWKVVDRKSVV